MNREDLAWAAGFFDGEGTTSLTNNRSLPCIGIGQADPVALERFKACVGGFGHISGPFKRKQAGWKPQWNYHCGKFEHVQQIVASMWLWLSPIKREQAARALQAYKTLCLNKPDMRRGQLICKRGHDLSAVDSVGNRSSGHRFCRVCAKAYKRKHKVVA